jgi:hypothetical protein
LAVPALPLPCLGVAAHLAHNSVYDTFQITDIYLKSTT